MMKKKMVKKKAPKKAPKKAAKMVPFGKLNAIQRMNGPVAKDLPATPKRKKKEQE